MKFLKLFAIVAIATLISCSKKEGNVVKTVINNQDFYSCDVAKIKDTVEVRLSDIVSDLKAIKLETKPEAYIKDGGKGTINDKYIMLGVYNKPYKLYSSNGQFIKDIGKIGKGPNEYRHSSSCFIINDNIWLHADRNKLLKYTLDEELPEVISTANEMKSFGITTINGSDLMVVGRTEIDSKKVSGFIQSTSGDIKNSLPEVSGGKSKSMSFSFSGSGSVHNVHNTIKLKVSGNDTIFTYNKADNTLTPNYFLYSAKSSEKKDVKKDDKMANQLLALNNKVMASYKGESSGYVFGEISSFKTTANSVSIVQDSFVIEKDENNASYIKNYVNDLFGGWKIKKFQFSNNKIYFDIAAIDLIEKVKKSLKENNISDDVKAKMKELIKGLDPEDNNVLFVGNIK